VAVLSPPYALGAAGQVLAGRLLRLSLGAAFRPGAGVTAASGVLAGPANTQGELTLAAGAVTVQPFRAVIQCSQDATAGQYVVTNDAPVVLPHTAQDATQFRRSLVVVDVDDSQVAGVASTAATDRARLYLSDGPLAASSAAAALPALDPNTLALGELLIPPAGQAVTLTPYNPRTTTRGGILPVLDDASAITGHAGAPPTHDGQYRDHPTRGLERGQGGVWGPPAEPGPWVVPVPGGRVNFGNGYPPFRYRLLPLSRSLEIEGMFTASAAAGVIHTLPPEYRPAYNRVIWGHSGVNAAVEVYVMTTGNITVPGTPGAYLAFHDIIPLN
jgi:hypothetical protein